MPVKKDFAERHDLHDGPDVGRRLFEEYLRVRGADQRANRIGAHDPGRAVPLSEPTREPRPRSGRAVRDQIGVAERRAPGLRGDRRALDREPVRRIRSGDVVRRAAAGAETGQRVEDLEFRAVVNEKRDVAGLGIIGE